jgi:replicative DNA helicase
MSSKELFCSPEIERLFISSILNYPDAYYSFSDIVNKNDFGKKIHQTCWIVISDILNKGEKLDYRLVALRLTELKIDFKNELPHNLTIADYLEGISFIKINKDLIEQYAVELKKLSGKKFLAEAALETYTALTEAKNDLSYSEIVQLADKTFNDKVNVFENNLEEDEPVDLYSGLESLIEEQGEKQDQPGIDCPYPILKKKYGDFYEGDLFIWASRAKSGKALEENTEIPTPEGWKKIKDLKVGDFVFAMDGTQTKVVATKSWENRNIYKISCNDGESLLADEEHEWLLQYRSDYKFKTYTSKELSYKNDRGRKYATLPKSGAINMQEAELPIDPYILGQWLGDGTSANTTFTTMDKETVKILKNFSEKQGLIFSKLKSKYLYSMNMGTGVSNPFKQTLKNLNVLSNKHIPSIYLRASISQRLELLRGLMDSDGYISKKKHGEMEFCNCNEKLAMDTLELIRSLGLCPRLRVSDAKLYGKITGTRYRINFYSNTYNVFKLSRKHNVLEKFINVKKKSTNRKIKSEYYGIGNTVCIQVEHESHMFLCGRNMIPTHNSLMLMNMLHSCCNSLNQNVKGLYIDTELETIRVQWRLMSMLTGINEYYFRTGKWRNNLHYVKAVRECWPMVKNFFGSVEHIYIGNRNVEEVCSIIRRWYKKNISIDPSLKGIIVYDYIKLATELMSNDYGKMKDYQMAGHKCDSLKKLASELKCPILTSVQTNRQNASKKMADRIDDANAIGLSDQIVQYCSNMYLFNRVLLEERQELQARYGLEKVTHRLVPVATRNQGEEAPGFDGDLIKIVNDDGSVKYLEDVIYYNVDNFRVEEVGNLFSLEKNREKYKLEDNQSENVELF